MFRQTRYDPIGSRVLGDKFSCLSRSPHARKCQQDIPLISVQIGKQGWQCLPHGAPYVPQRNFSQKIVKIRPEQRLGLLPRLSQTKRDFRIAKRLGNFAGLETVAQPFAIDELAARRKGRRSEMILQKHHKFDAAGSAGFDRMTTGNLQQTRKQSPAHRAGHGMIDDSQNIHIALRLQPARNRRSVQIYTSKMISEDIFGNDQGRPGLYRNFRHCQPLRTVHRHHATIAAKPLVCRRLSKGSEPELVRRNDAIIPAIQSMVQRHILSRK